MNNCPLISIVILNYNGLVFLKETIPVILNLNYLNYEIILVDNGSLDGSISFIEKYKNIKLIKNGQNLGYSKGKNIGIREANGDFILSLDDDILITDKDVLNKLIINYDKKTGFIQVPLLDLNKEKTFYYGIFYSIYGLNSHRNEVSIGKILDYKEELIPIVGPTGGVFFCSRENWQIISEFDESQSFHIDDCDIGPRSCIFGFKNYLFTKSYFIHLGVNKSSSIPVYVNRFKNVFSGHGRAILKNYKLSNIIWAFPIFFIFQLVKALRYSFKKQSFKVFFAFLFSTFFFIKNITETLKQRKPIQSKRVIHEDIFLKIKPPKFN
jgi:GT2 family glycosyltransferase